MSDLTIRIDDAGVRAALERFPSQMRAAIDAAIWRGAEEMARSAKGYAPKATSNLINSIRAERVGDLHFRVAPGVNYAAPVEYGRPRGKQPGTANGLMEWVKQKTRLSGTDLERTTFVIARAIAQRGINRKPFMRLALNEHKDRIVANVQAAARKAAQEFGRV